MSDPEQCPFCHVSCSHVLPDKWEELGGNEFGFRCPKCKKQLICNVVVTPHFELEPLDPDDVPGVQDYDRGDGIFIDARI